MTTCREQTFPIMYFQDERGQAGSWSESDGSVHDHPGRLLFHLNCISLFLYLYISVSLSLCILYLYTILLCRQSHPHSFTRVIISIITDSSAVSKFAVFMSKYIFRWKATQLSVHMVFKPDPYIDGERLFWFNQLIRSRPGPLPALLPPELFFLIPNTKY